MRAQVSRKKYQVVSYDVPVYRVALVKETSVKYERKHLSSPARTASLLAKYFEGHDRESFVVVMLDTKNRLIGINTASTGSLSQAIVHPREVFKPAILCNAASVVLAHNHPSGDPTPSQEDRNLQARLESAGQILGIAVNDHIIVGEDGDYFSFIKEKEQELKKQEAQYEARRLSACLKLQAKGRATGEDIVFIAKNTVDKILDIEKEKRPDELRGVIEMLTSVRNRKRVPYGVRREAITQIEKATAFLESFMAAKAA